MKLLEESILICRLFMKLMDEVDEAERETLLQREPLVRMLEFEEDRTRENVAQLLSNAPSSVLQEMYSDLSGEEWSNPYGDIEGTHWQLGGLRLFMSHNSSEKVFVSQVAEALEGYGVDGFVAHEDIKPLRTWENEIQRSLRQCQACVAFLSKDFHDSYWADQEVGFCFARDLLIVPIRMGADPYGFISRFQAITKGQRSAEEVAKDIFAALREDSRYDDVLDDALVTQFVAADSFIEAKDRWKLVKSQVLDWTTERRALVEVAAVRNSQVAGAHYGDLPRVLRIFLRDLPPPPQSD